MRMGNHGSKGTLNKNSGKYSKKSGLSKKYKKRDFQNNSKYKHRNKFSKVKIPLIPNVSIRKEDVNDPGFFHLFRSLFECAILGICSKASLEDIHIIRVLAKLLWDFKDWVPNSNSKKKSPCIKLEPPEKILYDGLKELIKKQILSRCPDLFTKPHMWFLIFQTFNSVVFWMQKNGRIGYLNYIAEDLKNVSENLNKLLKGDFNTEIESLQDNFPKFLSNQYSHQDLVGYSFLSEAVLISLGFNKNNFQFNKEITSYESQIINRIMEKLLYALDYFPNYIEIYLCLIYAEISLNNPNCALNYFIEAQEKFPNNSDLYIAASAIYFELKDFQKMIEVSNNAFLISKEPDSLLLIGIACYNLKDFQSALTFFEKQKQLNSLDPDIDMFINITRKNIETNDDQDHLHFIVEKRDFLKSLLANVKTICEKYLEDN